MHIKKQYRNAIKTQTLQYKAFQKQILEKAPREKHKELTKQIREEKMRKMADLSVQYDQSISEMLQRQTVRGRQVPCSFSIVASREGLSDTSPIHPGTAKSL